MNRQLIRVLLADPEQQVLSAYRSFLDTQDFDVATASNPIECWAKLAQWKPDVLVLEPDTPDGWADQILARLRDTSEHQLPVLILSKRRSRSVGYPIHAYHVKPISMHELMRSIREAVADGLRDTPRETELAIDEDKPQPEGS